jgi:hypothetical protein
MAKKRAIVLTSLRLPIPMLKRLRKICKRSQVSMAHYVEGLVAERFEKDEQAETQKRVEREMGAVTPEIGCVALCSRGRPGLVCGRKELSWGISWTGFALDNGPILWSSRRPRVIAPDFATYQAHGIVYPVLDDVPR